MGGEGWVRSSDMWQGSNCRKNVKLELLHIRGRHVLELIHDPSAASGRGLHDESCEVLVRGLLLSAVLLSCPSANREPGRGAPSDPSEPLSVCYY
jgi:hypothetical protein